MPPRPQLTVLVHPYPAHQHIIGVARALRLALSRRFLHGQAGPYAVFRSVERGCRQLGTKFNLNPIHSPVGEAVLVVEGAKALERALAWKRRGYCATLAALPIGDFPSDYDGIMLQNEIDLVLMPSEWVRKAWEEDAPLLARRMSIWAAGVDPHYWKPSGERRKQGGRAVLYWKTESPAFLASVSRIVEQHGWEAQTIRYGRYSPREYRRQLQAAELAIFVSRSETQGIALLEAWSCDVATAVWDPGVLTYRGRSFSEVTAAPYLGAETGTTWRTLDELDGLLANAAARLLHLSPRSWVLNNMTDRHSVERLLTILGAAAPPPITARRSVSV
jgi:hypothetical protein